MRHIVIVGGGFCGLTIAAQLQPLYAHRPNVHLTLIAARSEMVFSPYLTSIAAGHRSEVQGVISVESLCSTEHTEIVTQRACGLDLAAQQVLLEDGSQRPYSELALAVGLEHSPSAELEVRGATLHTLETSESAAAFCEALDQQPGRVLIVGGGCVGVELAALLRSPMPAVEGESEPACEVVLVERGPRLVSDFNAELSAEAYRVLLAHGAQVELSRCVVAIEGTTARLEGGGELEFDHVVWCGGTGRLPNWLAQSGLELSDDGRVCVGADLRVHKYAQVYAGGDIACVKGAESLPQRADVAVAQARVIAQNLNAEITGRARIVFEPSPTIESVTLGHGAAVANVLGPILRGRWGWGARQAQLTALAPGASQKLAVVAEAGVSALASLLGRL